MICIMYIEKLFKKTLFVVGVGKKTGFALRAGGGGGQKVTDSPQLFFKFFFTPSLIR